MTVESELAAAEAKANAARRDLTATLVDIQARLNPRSLIRDAAEELRDTGVEMLRAGLSQARKHPGPLIGIAATIAAYVARDWFISSTPATVADEGVSVDDEARVHARTPIKPRSEPKSPPRRKRP
ncbi:MAG: hypothetical protein K2P68_04260 [Sphingomonas sp.]|nr:hypothetical protein [Sphingomonas sp.]